MYGMYHGLGLDILGAYYSGGEVFESTLQMINMMIAYNNVEYDWLILQTLSGLRRLNGEVDCFAYWV